MADSQFTRQGTRYNIEPPTLSPPKRGETRAGTSYRKKKSFFSSIQELKQACKSIYENRPRFFEQGHCKNIFLTIFFW